MGLLFSSRRFSYPLGAFTTQRPSLIALRIPALTLSERRSFSTSGEARYKASISLLSGILRSSGCSVA
ncbi:MAG: hypothetical protein A2W93_00010 [Bacteroidetes bacterium GWF2_43_63]|nr:MAG: hypothetical protein A2W94_07300 [Bacteroidetes bacterium GWE2_42_42]OFY54723.1 MAG: hypothetical protein A2W93_00010 [Bacteroidetes bacterium GWF2_43_63]